MHIRHSIPALTRGLITAAAAAAVALALAGPAEAQASRTRPGGSSSGSGSGSSASSGGGSSSTGSSRSSSPSPSRVERTRPSSGSSSGPAVVERDRRPPRGRGGDGHHHHGYYGHYGSGWYPYAGWGWGWGWGPAWNWWVGYGHYPSPYGYYGPGGYYGPEYGGVAVYSGRVRPSMGAIDTDVWPAKAEVYIDGQYVGVVDNFDGFPRYLWLDEGTYDIAFYKPGFVTLARQITIRPGLVIDVEDRLTEGESVHPRDLASTSTEHRDERLAQNRARREAAARADEGWRERVRAERAESGPYARGGRAAEGDALDRTSDRRLDARGEPGLLRLDVRPGDAAVYLDGRFLGTGEELSRRESGVLIDPGTHKLSVVRPGHAAETRDFELDAGDEVSLDVVLEAI